jgi:hypothetical protein
MASHQEDTNFFLTYVNAEGERFWPLGFAFMHWVYTTDFQYHRLSGNSSTVAIGTAQE